MFLSVLLFLCFASASSFSAEVKGDTFSINGTKVIKLRGTHYERGYAYGFLLAKEILEVYEGYFVNVAMKEMKPYYSTLLLSFKTSAKLDDKYLQEVQGIIDGINATDYKDDFYDIWNRDIDKYDLLFANSIVELASNFGCSALMSWGDATPSLQGEMIVTRHLDWFDMPELYNNSLIVAHDPSEPDEQRWVSFGFAGLFGLLSGVNTSGVAAFQHMGNSNQYTLGEPYEPVFFTLRNAVELKDYNGDGACASSDIVDAIFDQTQGGTFIVDAIGAVKNQDSAVVIECTGTFKEVRSIGDNSNIPGTNLLATNHFRKLEPAAECQRYNAVQALLMEDDKITSERSWDIMALGAGLTNNLQVIQFIPSTKLINFGFTDEFDFGWDKEPFSIFFDDLFAPTSVVESSSKKMKYVKSAPNPASSSLSVELFVGELGNVHFEIVQSNGKVAKAFDLTSDGNGLLSFDLDLSDLNAGVYFLRATISGEVSTSRIIVVK